MFVFWWQGRGYQTILIWLLTLIAFEIVASIGKSFILIALGTGGWRSWRRQQSTGVPDRGLTLGALPSESPSPCEVAFFTVQPIASCRCPWRRFRSFWPLQEFLLPSKVR